MILTKEGKRFKDQVTKALAQNVDPMVWKELEYYVYEEGGFLVTGFWLGFTDIWNQSWYPGRLTKDGKPSAPYRRKDASNYIKLLEDAVTKATGIDDANTLGVSAYKVPGRFIGIDIACHLRVDALSFEG